MQRILERGQIESIPHAEIERVRKPCADRVFADRAQRLRTLSANHAIGDYLRLMAALADSQQRVLATRIAANLPAPSSLGEMPWHEVLREICGDLLGLPGLLPAVRETCAGLSAAAPARLEAQAQALLGLSTEPVDAASAPFVMGALQVCWTNLAVRSASVADRDSKSPGGCPVCDGAPVASIVHVEGGGHRYLVCSLCASEWHFVRALCTHCGSSKGISEQSIEGGAKAVRAECCDNCRTYRKIFYCEHDAAVESVADDLASLALDLLLSDAGYRRSSGHPLLWQA
jgi:FdhE protein